MGAERIESQLTVPASTTCSVSNGAQTSAVTCTLTAGTYFPTTLAAHLQTLFNANVNGYPRSAAALASVIGGTWTSGSGWLCDESATPLVPAFGSPNLTAGVSPTYLNAGPAGGVDYAVGFDSAGDAFAGGNVFDVSAADDLIIAWVAYLPADLTDLTTNTIVTKEAGGARYRLFMYRNSASSCGVGLQTNDGVDDLYAVTDNASAALNIGAWHVGIAVVDRSTNRSRVATYNLTTGVATVSAETNIAALGSMSNAAAFTVGSDVAAAWRMSALYVVEGSGVATGLSAGLSTAVASLGAAIGSSFTVSLSTTTGLVSVSNSFWPSYVTFNSTLRSTLGFAYDFDYPQTAAQMATALGYGTWTSGAGYLCNETSGDLAAAFGTPATLADSGTTTYANQGARGGADKAIGFGAITDYFNGGDYHDVGATDDLIVVWVGKFSSAVSGGDRTLFSKQDTPRWSVETITTGEIQLVLYDGVDATYAQTANTGQLTKEWHVGVAVLDRGATASRMGVLGLTSGTSVISAATSSSSIGDCSNSVGFKIGGYSGPPTEFQVAAVYITTGSGVATGLSSNLSTALSNFATYMKSQTGTMQAECLWIPGCSLSLDSGDPSVAPIGDDARATVSPDGNVYGTSETTFYHHRGLRFSRVNKAKVWANHATYVNADWETFYLDTQVGQHAWATPFSRVKVYFDNAGTATELGGGDVAGWKMPSPTKLNQLRNAVDPWTGLVDVKLGDLFASE
jgi:hypothetical protein